jgi:hypothetical protein
VAYILFEEVDNMSNTVKPVIAIDIGHNVKFHGGAVGITSYPFTITPVQGDMVLRYFLILRKGQKALLK